MKSLIKLLENTYREIGIIGVIIKTFSFLETRLYTTLGRFMPPGIRKRLLNNIYCKQSHDEASLVFNNIISGILTSGRRADCVIVPNFLGSVFSLTRPLYCGQANVIRYDEIGDHSATIDAAQDRIFVIHDPMMNQLQSGLAYLEGLDLTCNISSYKIFSKPDRTTTVEPEKDREQIVEMISTSSSDTNNQVEKYGFVFNVRPMTFDSQIIDEVHNEYMVKLSEKGVSKLETIIDLGGHIGSFSIQASSLLTVSGKIYVVEPLPDNKALIDRNIASNSLKHQITSIENAVADKPGTGTLYISTDNTGGHKLNNIESSSKSTIQVTITTLNNLIKEHNIQNIDLLKVDVEGSEHAILFSAKELLENSVRYIICEAGGSIRGDGIDVVKFLEELGYEVEYSGNEGQLILFAENKKSVRCKWSPQASAAPVGTHIGDNV